jgi:hypothetical protein
MSSPSTATLSGRIKDSFLRLFGLKESFEQAARYQRVSKLDNGDLWYAMRQGEVSVEDIAFYALVNAKMPEYESNAAHHLQRLAEYYQDKGDKHLEKFFAERAIGKYGEAGRPWEAALLCLAIGNTDQTRTWYPKLDKDQVSLLERRIAALRQPELFDN